MKNTLLTICLILASQFSYAQQQQIKDFFTSYIDAINNLGNTKDLAPVMAYLSPDFQVNRTFIGPNGRVERSVLSLTAYAQGLQALTGDREINPNITIDEISKIIEGPSTATLSAVLSMNMNVDGMLAEQGGFVVNYAMVKNKEGNWKMVHSDVVRTLIQRNVGNCPTRFYTRETALVAELYYPAGFEYKSELEAFKFKTVDKKRTVTNDFRLYDWDADGSLYRLEDENRVKLGAAADEKEAAKLILGQLYRVHCLSFSRR